MTTDGPVVCVRLQLQPMDLRADDVLVCEYTGFHHVHGVKQHGNLVDILVCEDEAHVYNINDTVEIARPVTQGH